MIEALMLTQLVMIMSITSSKNPVKMSALILISSILLFIQIWMNSSMTWIPLVMSLLFSGGILVMFMILSSFEPNESADKMKGMKVAAVAATVLILSPKIFPMEVTSQSEWILAEKITSYFQESSTMFFIVSIMILYFWVFVQVLKKEQNSMRSLTCQTCTNLVS